MYAIACYPIITLLYSIKKKCLPLLPSEMNWILVLIRT